MTDWNNTGNGYGGSYGDSTHDHVGGNDSGFEPPSGDHGGDRTCRSCGQEGHFARECPDKLPMLCRVCNQEGHFAKECPEKPAQICKNCGQEGHIRQNCENARLMTRENVATVSPEAAWEKIRQAAMERDVDDAREAVQEYMKSMDGTPTYRDLQEGFIGDNVNLWFIGLQRDLVPIFTNMDLQGNMGKKFSISWRFSEKPERPIEVDGWPATRDEILARLDDAGEPTNSGKSLCGNCREVGHIAKECSQGKEERQAIEINCDNCKGVGHRVRDCPQPRTDRNACRNCGKSGHRANECEEPPNMDNVECRKCNEKGHFAKDCPTAPAQTCRNCDQPGHMSRDCPLPRDYSRVQCSNCGVNGHTKVRCKQAPINDDGFDAPSYEDKTSAGSGGAPSAGTGGGGGPSKETEWQSTVASDDW